MSIATSSRYANAALISLRVCHANRWEKPLDIEPPVLKSMFFSTAMMVMAFVAMITVVRQEA